MSTEPITTSDDFKKGVKSAFDYILLAAANNYHVNAAYNARRQEMNEWIEELAVTALEELSPDDCMTWKTGNQMYQEGFENGKRAK